MGNRTRLALDEKGVRLILEHAASVLHLETLLLIWEGSARPWSVKELASRIYIDRKHAQGIVHDLEGKGLLVDAGEGRYAITAEPAAREIAGTIAALYRSNIFRVANLLHASQAAAAEDSGDRPRHRPGDP